jgi:tetratricopeptide (TPR) repeat protein
MREPRFVPSIHCLSRPRVAGPVRRVAGFSRLIVGLLLVSAATPAFAQLTSAQTYLDRGLRSYAVGQYPEAIADFRAGYKLEPRPDFLYALGQAERMSGDCRAAVNSYRAFLRTSPPGVAAESARQNIDRCEKQLAAAPVEPAATVSTPATPSSPTRRPWSRDPAGASLTAVGLACVVAGGVLWGVGESTVVAANDASHYDDFAAQQAAGQRGEHERLAGIVTLSVGGVALVAGLARWAWVARHK